MYMEYVIETPRLILRPFRDGDEEAMFTWTSDPEVTRYLRFRTHTDISQCVEFLNVVKDGGTFPHSMNFAITLKERGTPIGSIGIDTENVNDRRGDVGYGLKRSEWGKGYMSEALPRVLLFGFQQMNLHRIEATHCVDNPASGRVMEKANMVKEADCLRHYVLSNQVGYMDSALYAAFADTYQLPF